MLKEQEFLQQLLDLRTKADSIPIPITREIFLELLNLLIKERSQAIRVEIRKRRGKIT